VLDAPFQGIHKKMSLVTPNDLHRKFKGKKKSCELIDGVFEQNISGWQ